MKINTSDLIGPALDWAVAVAMGMSYWTPRNAIWDTDFGYTEWVLDDDGVLKRFEFDGSRSRAGHWCEHERYTPSTDWSQSGPIIERELICLDLLDGFAWVAYTKFDGPGKGVGPTPLIAAMRCFVSSKLGDTVEVPDELMQ